jgi:hypothetical protein
LETYQGEGLTRATAHDKTERPVERWVACILKKKGGYAAAKGKRTKSKGLRNVLGKTKADVAAAVAGEAPVPER